MNHLRNGSIAVGAPGSPARIAAEWDDMHSGDRCDILRRWYVSCQVVDKFSLQTWSQLPTGLRGFLTEQLMKDAAQKRG